MVRFILKPAYSHVAGARDFFSPETEFSLPVLSYFSRHLPAPFRSDGEGEVVFFYDFENPVFGLKPAETRVGRARARARDCLFCSGNDFFGISPHGKWPITRLRADPKTALA